MCFLEFTEALGSVGSVVFITFFLSVKVHLMGY